MKNVAVIRADKFECVQQINLIKERFHSLSVEPIFIHSISEMQPLLDKLRIEGDRPFIYLRSPWEWVDYPKDLIEMHAANTGFENLASEKSGDRLTYVPSKVFVHNDALLNYKEKFGRVYTFLVNVEKKVTRPQLEAPRIFVTTHNRHQYLNLTLNALFHSIDRSVPVTILLNEAIKEVKEVVARFDFENVDVLEIEKNCFYSSINLAIQWYQPSTFIVCEDDFILPHTAKEYYQDWVYHFAQRLNYCDLVGWSPSIDNAPSFHRFPKDRNPVGEWTVGGKLFSQYPLLLGNCLAMKAEFWRESLRKNPNKWFTALDSCLHSLADTYCTPSLKGYHIGWNQQVDGFGSLFDREFTPPIENKVTNTKTGETRVFRLNEVIEGL